MLLVMGLFLFCLTVFVAGVSEMTPVGYEIKDCTLFPSNVTYIDRDIWITRSISCDEDKVRSDRLHSMHASCSRLPLCFLCPGMPFECTNSMLFPAPGCHVHSVYCTSRQLS